LATKTYCQNHVDDFLAEGYNEKQIYVNIDLCGININHVEYLDKNEREEKEEENTPYTPDILWGSSINIIIRRRRRRSQT
jgi:hypothetical protein